MWNYDQAWPVEKWHPEYGYVPENTRIRVGSPERTIQKLVTISLSGHEAVRLNVPQARSLAAQILDVATESSVVVTTITGNHAYVTKSNLKKAVSTSDVKTVVTTSGSVVYVSGRELAKHQ